MGALEGTCQDCGRPVRRFATSTGWKHVNSGTSGPGRCPTSPPSRVRLPGDPDPELEALRQALGR